MEFHPLPPIIFFTKDNGTVLTSTPMITYGLTTSKIDLQQILNLQKDNLPSHISKEEALQQGFVTVQHDLALLQKMHASHPHVVARAADHIVGYTLVMLREFAEEIPVLVPMFRQIHHLTYKKIPLRTARYVIMGQVCIAKAYRGQGIFKGLYHTMKTTMQQHFDYIITEISQRNARSLNAHYKAGFSPLKTYTSEDGETWVIVLLDITSM